MFCDTVTTGIPDRYSDILHASEAADFNMRSDLPTGSLLATLAVSKPGGRFLEIGTGTGLGTAWILSGMDAKSTLESVDSEVRWVDIAKRFLAHDPRVTFYVEDGEAFLRRRKGKAYDFIYADSWPGKFTDLEATLDLLAAGGFYIIDDLLPQPNWPDGHAPKIPKLIDAFEKRPDLLMTKLCWSSGLMIVTKRSSS